MSLLNISQQCDEEKHYPECNGQITTNEGSTECQCACHPRGTIPSTSFGTEGKDTMVDKTTS